MFDGNVLMNKAATKDAAVMAALRSLQEQNWEFKSHPTGHWNISDKGRSSHGSITQSPGAELGV